MEDKNDNKKTGKDKEYDENERKRGLRSVFSLMKGIGQK
jgi:hypothetical protein